MRLRVKGAYPMELSDTFRPAIELDASSSANRRLKHKNQCMKKPRVRSILKEMTV